MKVVFIYISLLTFGLVADQLFNAYIHLTIIFICINMVLGMSLNLVSGYTGQFSLGHAGFMAIGAYTSAFLSANFLLLHWPNYFIFIICSLLGGGLAALAGWLVGQPSLRLIGDYLAIVSLGFSEIIRVIILNTNFLGGARGLYSIHGFQNTEWSLGDMQINISRFFPAFSQASFWVMVTFLILWRLKQSSYGRVFLSVKDDEIAAESLGIDTTQAKVRAFMLSSFFAGVAGSIFAHFTNYLNPSSFGLLNSINIVIIVVLGGLGSLSGTLISAVIVTLLPEVLRSLQDLIGFDIRMIVYALLLILIMILRPQGLFGNTEINSP